MKEVTYTLTDEEKGLMISGGRGELRQKIASEYTTEDNIKVVHGDETFDNFTGSKEPDNFGVVLSDEDISRRELFEKTNREALEKLESEIRPQVMEKLRNEIRAEIREEMAPKLYELNTVKGELEKLRSTTNIQAQIESIVKSLEKSKELADQISQRLKPEQS